MKLLTPSECSNLTYMTNSYQERPCRLWKRDKIEKKRWIWGVFDFVNPNLTSSSEKVNSEWIGSLNNPYSNISSKKFALKQSKYSTIRRRVGPRVFGKQKKFHQTLNRVSVRRTMLTPAWLWIAVHTGLGRRNQIRTKEKRAAEKDWFRDFFLTTSDLNSESEKKNANLNLNYEH